jgi:uncharacterized protein YndB with AHSA1/START domain
MMDERWSSFKIVADIKAPVSEIYRAWTSPAGIESWFLKRAIFTGPDGERRADEHFQAGDKYDWRWHGFADDVFEKREILEANGRDLLKFSFSGDCIVTVSIAMHDDISLVTLTQENIPLENDPDKSIYVGCHTGWLFYLANLKSILQGGVDLRNKRLDVDSTFK